MTPRPVRNQLYPSRHSADLNYNAADGPCESLDGSKLTPTVSTTIHNADHNAITTAPIGSTVHDSASVTGSLGAGTGTVSCTGYLGVTNCSTDGRLAGS